MDRRLRLLCLDGGGVRGLSSLCILKQLMEAIDRKDPPKPCDFFHMMGGTSTGGLIAIMLGRLEMSIDDCIDCYVDIMDRVFRKSRHRINARGKLQGRYDTQELEECIKDIIADQGIDFNTKFRVKGDDKCKVFVCVVNSETRDVEQLTSYERDFESMSNFNNEVKIWEAARATSAATTLFDPISIGRGNLRQRFVDGATGANNPVRRLWQEAQRQWGGPLEPQIQCLVSVGTGGSVLKSFGEGPKAVFRTLKAIATDTERTAMEFQTEHDELSHCDAYIRLNVTHGLEDVGLDEAAKKGRIMAATRRYGELPDVQNAFKKFRAAVVSSSKQSVQDDLRNMNFVDEAQSPTSEGPVRQSQHQGDEEGMEMRSPHNATLQLLENNTAFFKQPAENYWDHLTVNSLRRYEVIYEEACDALDGLVSCKADIKPQILRQAKLLTKITTLDNDLVNFWYGKPRDIFPGWEEILERDWTRLAPLNDLLPKNLTMALLYMFHVASIGRALIDVPEPMSWQTHKALRAFGNWVNCACHCGRNWNFASSMYGLRDDYRRTRLCIPGAWKDLEDPDSLQEELLRAPSLFKENVKGWYEKQEYPVAAKDR